MGQIDTNPLLVCCLLNTGICEESAENKPMEMGVEVVVAAESFSAQQETKRTAQSGFIHLVCIFSPLSYGREHLSCIRITTTFLLHYVMHSVWRLSSHMRERCNNIVLLFMTVELKSCPSFPFFILAEKSPAIPDRDRTNAN